MSFMYIPVFDCKIDVTCCVFFQANEKLEEVFCDYVFRVCIIKNVLRFMLV